MPEQHLLDRPRVDRHAGRGQIERGGAQILEARGGGPDRDHLAGECAVIDIARQHPPCGDGAPRLGAGEVQPHAPGFVGRNHESAHRHFLDGRQRPLDAGLRHPDLVAVRPEQHSEHLRGEARADLVPEPEHQGNAAQHPVDGRKEVEATDSARAGVDTRQIGDRAGELRQHRERAGPGNLENVGTRWPHRVRPAGQGEPGDHRCAPHRVGQHRVVRGQVLGRFADPGDGLRRPHNGMTFSGEVRSGSARMMSSPMTAAPASRSPSIRFATRVRGQGHWPIRPRLASSMSTTTTGAAEGGRGDRRWYASKTWNRRLSTNRGARTWKARAMASAANGTTRWSQGPRRRMAAMLPDRRIDYRNRSVPAGMHAASGRDGEHFVSRGSCSPALP